MQLIMPRKMIPISILFIASVLVNGTVGKGKTEKLEATVLAYDIVKATTPCHRECEGSLIVKIYSADSENPRYGRIDFTFRHSSSFPSQLITLKRLWQLTVVRTQSLDEPIYEYIVQKQTSYGEEKKYQNWELVPGAKDEKLPFGETLPSYAMKEFKLVR